MEEIALYNIHSGNENDLKLCVVHFQKIAEEMSDQNFETSDLLRIFESIELIQKTIEDEEMKDLSKIEDWKHEFKGGFLLLVDRTKLKKDFE